MSLEGVLGLLYWLRLSQCRAPSKTTSGEYVTYLHTANVKESIIICLAPVSVARLCRDQILRLMVRPVGWRYEYP